MPRAGRPGRVAPSTSRRAKPDPGTSWDGSDSESPPSPGRHWFATRWPFRRSWTRSTDQAWWALGALAVVLACLLAAAAVGGLGELTTCGADGARVCVAWPGIASTAMWLIFIGTVAALGAWQIREWRGTNVRSSELRWLLILLVLALIERAWRPDLAQVAYDEASAASLVAAWHFQGLFPLTGIISSVGVPNPPAWPYLLALALLPFDSPYALVGLGVATGLLSVGLTWCVGRRWIGAWGALAAATFYAGGFWASFLGRGGWQPAFLQVPVILCLDALLLLAVRRWPWALVIACGWLALMVQLHYIAVLFAALLPLAAWPARRALRPIHVVSAALVATVLVLPFLIYELNPAVRVRDLGLLLDDAGGTGSHWDFESWNLLWTLASNGGAAGLGGPGAAGLGRELGRWTALGLLGIPLVGAGVLAAVLGWPKGWRGWLIGAWVAMPVVGLAHHTLGVLFHYLYLGLPGMALSVGALAESLRLVSASSLVSRWRGGARSLPVLMFAAVLTAYVGVSAATLGVVLEHVDRTGAYPGLGKPLGLNIAAAAAAHEALRPGDQVLVGGYYFAAEILRFSLGYATPSRLFDDCSDVPTAPSSIYLLDSQHTPAADILRAAGSPELARVPRPDDAFLIFGQPSAGSGSTLASNADAAACRDRWH